MNAPSSVSVVDPVGKAYEWMLQVLFRPFDPGKWFTIGFCAWLAFFGESGGGSFNFPGGGGQGGHGGSDFRGEMERAHEFVLANLYWIIPVVAGVILLALAFMVLFTWLSSRGKFMFLHCVSRNVAEVSLPWNQYRKLGNSLFRFRLVLALLSFVAILSLLIPTGFFVISLLKSGEANPWTILFLVAIGFAFLLVVLVCWVAKRVIEDFLVPLMFLKGLLWREGLREAMALLSGNLGTFILYLLFQIVLGLATGLVALAVVLCTCCIAGCLMMIPYLGTVLLLPILVFYRAYSLFFLAQFGPQFDAFASAQTQAVGQV